MLQVSSSGAQVLLIASCTDAARLPKLLRATGRLDHFIEVGTPSTGERRGMIAHMLRLSGYRRALAHCLVSPARQCCSSRGAGL